MIGNTSSDGLFGGGGDDSLYAKYSVSANDSLNGGTHVSGDKNATDATGKSIVGFP